MRSNASSDSLTRLEGALLGLLSQQERSGYDIKKLFETTPMRHFSSSPGAIYPALQRMEKRGWLEERLDDTTPARPRRVFRLSLAGWERFRAWLAEDVTREEIIVSPGMGVLRLSFMEGQRSRTEVLAYLSEWERVLKIYLEELRPLLGEVEAQSLLGGLALRQGIQGFEGELCWIAQAKGKVDSAMPE